MKKLATTIIVFWVATQFANSQNVGINTTGAAAETSAMLDVVSTNKGFLVPRMTSVQRVAIATPATGLMVYDNTTNTFWYYNATWQELTTEATNKNGIYDGDGTTPAGTDVTVTDFINIDANTFFVDGANNRIGIGTNTASSTLDVVGSFQLTDGNQAAGRVLTSDASGNATWQAPVAGADGDGIYDGNGTTPSNTAVTVTDNINFDANTFYVDGTNNRIGIGTLAPSSNLHVKNVGATSPAGAPGNWATLIENNHDLPSENGLLVANRWGGNTSTIFEVGSYWNGVSENYTPALTVLGDRNVGIGTAAPQGALHVSGAVGASSWSYFQGNLNGTANPAATVNTGLMYGWNASAGQGEGDLLYGTALGGGHLYLGTWNGTTKTRRFIFTTTGRFGIGTLTPGGQLELSLNEGRKPGSNTWTVPSDERLKTIHGSYAKGLNEILKLKPITYNYKNVGERKFEEKILNTEFAGFSAQEVQKIFPEAVGTDDDGYLNFNIHAITVAHIKATQEQQTLIENQQKEIDKLKEVVKQLINNK